MIKNLLSNLLHLVPRELRYEICRHHADKEYAEENNSDFTTNGELWFLENVLPDTKTVFDVGSFIGKWVSSALGINPSIDLHCFEPNQRSFRELQNNRFGDNVTCNQFGLGSKNYQAKLFVYDGLNEGNSLYLRKGIEHIVGYDPQIKAELVEIKTLDSYCREKDIHEIDFLKVDVEGHELAVIQGGRELFESECIKIAQFEYGGCYIDSRILLRDFFDFFEEMAYEIYLLHPSRVCYIPRYDQRMENFRQKNFLVVNHKVMTGNNIFSKE